MKHSDCGGHVGEYGNKYRYCSEHDNGCDTATCPKAVDIPEYRCDKCGQEITGDAQMEVEEQHEQHLHLQKRTEESVLPRAHGLQGEAAPAEESLSEVAKRALVSIRAARETLRRIMEHEAPYLGD